MTVHTCHHPTCQKPVSPKMLACKPHWYSLPRELREQIWDRYRPGQEADKRPSTTYLATMRECIAFWIKETENQPSRNDEPTGTTMTGTDEPTDLPMSMERARAAIGAQQAKRLVALEAVLTAARHVTDDFREDPTIPSWSYHVRTLKDAVDAVDRQGLLSNDDDRTNDE